MTADYEAETAVERELVLRLASLLWRLRRATSIETGLLQMQLEIPQEPKPTKGTEPNNGCAVTTLVRLGQPAEVWANEGDSAERGYNDDSAASEVQLVVARRFLRLADLDNGVFERLGRYEAALWRQVRQTLFTLEELRWRTSYARRSRTQHSWPRSF